MAEPPQRRPVPGALAPAHPLGGSGPGGPAAAGGPGAGRLVPLLGGRGRHRRHSPWPAGPGPRVCRADRLYGAGPPVRTTLTERWGRCARSFLHSRTQYPGPVPAARAGECLLILFPRTGTRTDLSAPVLYGGEPTRFSGEPRLSL